MFPIPFNFPFRKKNGDMTTIGDAIDNAGGGGEPYVLPVASETTLGGIKVGSGLSILDGVLSAAGGGSGSSSHLYHGTCNNGFLKEFYILSSVDYDGTSVPLNQMRAILFGGVGFVVPHADAQYNDAGRIPTFFTIASATATKLTVITMDLVIDNSAIKYTKNIAEPEYNYLATQFSMSKIF